MENYFEEKLNHQYLGKAIKNICLKKVALFSLISYFYLWLKVKKQNYIQQLIWLWQLV